MFCILAFILFVIFFPILGFFPEYRKLFRKSWQCFFKRVTFQPCDISLEQEVKAKFLSKFYLRFPKTAKFFEKTFTFWVFLFVIINIWSLVYTISAGLNLWVYDTCEINTGEGCSLSGEACGVQSTSLTFEQAIKEDKIFEYAFEPLKTFADTVSKVPNRLKNWKAEDYLPDKPIYYKNFDNNKKTAIEAIDPSCQYCANLYSNIQESKFYEKYNLTFLLYPIPSNVNASGYRFQHSYMMSLYIEATKDIKPSNPKNLEIPPSWQLLKMFFSDKGEYNNKLQEDFKSTYSKEEAEKKIADLLLNIGYSDQEINQIKELTNSDSIKSRLNKQKEIVEKDIQTIKIPTIIFNGRRYDRVVDVKTLSQ